MRTFPSIEPLMKTLSLMGLKLTHVTASKAIVRNQYSAKNEKFRGTRYRTTNIMQIMYQHT